MTNMQVQRSLTGTPFNAVQDAWEGKPEGERSLAVRGFRLRLIKAEFSSLLHIIYEFVRVLLALPFQCSPRCRDSLKFHWTRMWQHLESAKLCAKGIRSPEIILNTANSKPISVLPSNDTRTPSDTPQSHSQSQSHSQPQLHPQPVPRAPYMTSLSVPPQPPVGLSLTSPSAFSKTAIFTKPIAPAPAAPYVFNEHKTENDKNLAKDIDKEKLRDPEGWYKGAEMKKCLLWATKYVSDTHLKVFIEKGVPVDYQLEAENADREIVTAPLIYWAVQGGSGHSFYFLKRSGASTEGMLALAIQLFRKVGNLYYIIIGLYKTEPWDVVFSQPFVDDPTPHHTYTMLIERMKNELCAAEKAGEDNFAHLEAVLERGLPRILSRMTGSNFPGATATNFLWLLEHLDITGLNLVGMSINGYPITHEMVKHCKGSEGAIITKTELDAAAQQDEATFGPLKEKIERFIALGRGRLLEDSTIDLVRLQDAAAGGNLSAVQHLCPRVESTPDTLKDAFISATTNGHWAVAAYLFQNCAEKQRMTFYLNKCIKEEGVDVVAQLIGDLDINEISPNILSDVIDYSSGLAEKIRFLISRGARFPDEDSKKGAVWKLIRNDAVDVLRIIFPFISQEDNWQIPYIYQAATNANEKTLRFLVESGGDINGKIAGKEPLLLEVLSKLMTYYPRYEKSYINIFFYLLDLLPTVKDYKNNNGSNLLHHAMVILSFAQEPVGQLYESLISKGADVNDANNRGLTPLHVAIQCDNEGGVDFLLAHGASVTSADKKGYTPLHAAINNERGAKYEVSPYYRSVPIVAIVTKLLASGADKNAKTVDGKTPYDLALEAIQEKQPKVRFDELSQIIELLKPDDAPVATLIAGN